MSGRVGKSIMNMEVSLLFFFMSLLLTFFSRKIFLDSLGTEFMGLTGTLASILGYLNLAELGIVQCVSFFLYKPLQEGDRRETTEIMSVLGFLYRWIGIVIAVCGVGVSLFFPLIFGQAEIDLRLIYFVFFSLLASSLMGYFINYRQILLNADQKNYLVAIYFQSATILKTVAQIAIAYQLLPGDLPTPTLDADAGGLAGTGGYPYYLWASMEVVFGIVGCIVLNHKIDREYPWLHTDKSQGHALLRKYPGILTYTRQIFIHKIKDFMLNRSDELFVFAFVSLKMVAFYGNYMLIITRIISLLGTVRGSVSASVGNLVAEGDKKRTLGVFWEFITMQHILAGIVAFAIYTLVEPLIAVWLGPQYVMDHAILVLLTVFVFFTNARTAIDSFNHGYGLYADVWAAWAEFIVNVGVTIVCGLQWGIIGILIGKLASQIPIVVLWKPYYLFSSGFHEPVKTYWRGIVRNYGVFIIAFALATMASKSLPIDPYKGFAQWMVYAAATTIIFTVIAVAGNLLCCYGARDLVKRMGKRKK